MGLISKIEDKLSGSDKNSSKLEKTGRSSYEGGSNNGLDSSTLRHPISSAETKNHGSNTSGIPGENYGSGTSGTTSGGAFGKGTSGTTSGATTGMSAGAPTGVNRDGYGTQSSSGYGNDGYGSTSSEYPKQMERMPGGYESSADRVQPSDAGGQSSRYDPYSRKGQQTAAGAVIGGSGAGHSSTQAQDYASNDPNVSRSKHGGITNSMDDARYGTTSTGSHGITSGSHNQYDRDAPLASGGAGGNSIDDPRYGTATSTSHGSSSGSQHHYGRDATLAAGGAGAAGLGGYEASNYSHRDPGTTSHQDPSVAYGQSTNTNPNDISYMRRSGGTGQYESEGRPSADSSGYGSTGTSGIGSTGAGTTATSATGTSGTGQSGLGSSGPGETVGLSQAKKMGGAYERGYQDAMEHMKAEMEQLRTSK